MRQSPLIKPIQLDDQLNYPLFAVFNDEKIEQLSLASHTNSFGQFEKKYERFSISMLSPSPRIKKEENYHSLILKASHRHALDPALIKAIIMAESGFNPKAISKKGAKGLMQLMPNTAKAMGVKDVFDPEQNIEGGVRYFKKLLTTFKGDIKLALAAYNAGSRKVKEYKGIPPYNVTKYYIKKVIKFRKKYSRQMAEDASDV